MKHIKAQEPVYVCLELDWANICRIVLSKALGKPIYYTVEKDCDLRVSDRTMQELMFAPDK